MERRLSWMEKQVIKNIERAGQMSEIDWPPAKIASELGVSDRTGRRYVQRYREAKKDAESKVL